MLNHDILKRRVLGLPLAPFCTALLLSFLLSAASASADSHEDSSVTPSELEAAVTTLEAADTAEAAARTSADTTLGGRIDTEATTRGDADTALEAADTAEGRCCMDAT